VAKKTSPAAYAADTSTQNGSVMLDSRISNLVNNSPYLPSTEILKYQENSSNTDTKKC